MTTEQWLKDLADDIVMEHGVDYPQARAMIFVWVFEMTQWDYMVLRKMLDYYLND